jgi:hypothetical protein
MQLAVLLSHEKRMREAGIQAFGRIRLHDTKSRVQCKQEHDQYGFHREQI